MSYKEFETLARTREELAARVEETEDELEAAEKEATAAIAAAQDLVSRARARARSMRKQLRNSEQVEDDAYRRELASIEELERMEREELQGMARWYTEMPSTTGTLPVNDLDTTSELLEYPNLGQEDPYVTHASPFAGNHIDGFSGPSWPTMGWQ